LSEFQFGQIGPNNILARRASGEISTPERVWQRGYVAFFPDILRPDAAGIPLSAMLRWRMAMREISAEARLHWYARSLSGRTTRRLNVVAIYSAFAVIAAVVFGTLSYHPF
jgi:hypothetical protein